MVMSYLNIQQTIWTTGGVHSAHCKCFALNNHICEYTAFKGLWEHLEPVLAPGFHQFKGMAQPLWEPLRPYINDALHQANTHLHGYGFEPFTLVALAVGATFLLMRAMGAFRRITSLVAIGTAVAYLWPLVADKIKQL